MNALAAITEVLTPAASDDLVSLADVKGDIGVTGTEDDLYLQRRVTEMSLAAIQYMNRRLQVEKLRDSFWPQRDPYPWQLPGGVMPLQLSRWPLTAAPTLVTEQGVALAIGVDYVADLSRGQLTRIFGYDAYPSRWDALPIIVEYAAGFDPIPLDVAAAVARAVKAQYFARSRDPAIKSQSVTGVYAATYLDRASAKGGLLTPDVCSALDNYRVPVVA